VPLFIIYSNYKLSSQPAGRRSRMADAGGGADGRRARVALFPLPFQGHISPMLQLAGALRARGLAVTVLHTAFNAPDPARHPGLAFVAVPDAIPEAAAAAAANGIPKILALNAAMEASGRVRVALASLMAAAEGDADAVKASLWRSTSYRKVRGGCMEDWDFAGGCAGAWGDREGGQEADGRRRGSCDEGKSEGFEGESEDVP
jgi:hypothetical protein